MLVVATSGGHRDDFHTPQALSDVVDIWHGLIDGVNELLTKHVTIGILSISKNRNYFETGK